MTFMHDQLQPILKLKDEKWLKDKRQMNKEPDKKVILIYKVINLKNY